MRAKYKRVLLKISGEALAGTNGFGLDEHTIAHISENEAVKIWTEQELTIWVCLQLR